MKSVRTFGMAAMSAALLIGCAETPHGLVEPAGPQLSTTYGATLLECPTNEARSARGTVGALGGTMSLGNHRISIPLGAVRTPTEFEIVEPVSNHMEVRVRAVGAQNFEFNAPATITISYERCTRSNINRRELRAWHVDPATKTLLEPMGGTDDKEARTVTFSTGHLSGYAIAE